jgi:hypothetical protein
MGGDLLAMIVLAGGVSGLVMLFSAYNRASMKRLEDVWTRTATELGGSFTPGETSWLSSKPMSIHAEIDGVDVHIDHYEESSGRSSTSYTRLRARTETLAAFKMSLHKEGVLASVSKVLGAQDVEVGDPRFDAEFVVKTNDEGLARAWLAPRVTAAVWGAPYAPSPLPYYHALEEGLVISTRVGIEGLSVELALAARATAAIAGRGRELRSAWQEVAHELEGIVEADLWGPVEPRIEIPSRGSGVTIELTDVPSGLLGKKLVTRVSARRSRALPDRFVAANEGTLTEDDGEVVTLLEAAKGAMEVRSKNPRAIASRFDRELVLALEGVSPARVVDGGEEVAVLFPGLELDVARLGRAVHLVAGLTAVDPGGPYR